MTNPTFSYHIILPTCLLWLLLMGPMAQGRPVLNGTPAIPAGLNAQIDLKNAGDGNNLLSNFPTVITLLSFTAKAEAGYNELRWKIIRAVNLKEFEVEYSVDGMDWIKAGTVLSQENNADPEYYFKHPTNIEGLMFYRLKMIGKDRTLTPSQVISIDTHPHKGNELQLFPTVNSYGPLQVQLNEPFINLQVFNMQGQALLTRNLQNQTGIIRLNVSGFSKGPYVMVVSRADKRVSKTFMVQ